MVRSTISGEQRANFTQRKAMPRSRAEQHMPQDTQVDIKKSDALIIGNGKSRLVFDLHELNAIFVTYGCNALYRDFMPDYLVSMDSNMVDEILNHQVYNRTKFYTQHCTRTDRIVTLGKLPVYFVSNEKETRDSGNTSIKLACENGHKKIYMIGFDYISTPDKKFNNVYAGTKNYSHSNGDHIHINQVEKWRQRIRTLAKQYTDVEFIRVNGNDYSLGMSLDNFIEITPEQFKEKINEL